MARPQDPQEPDNPASFAARLRKTYGEGVDPQVSLGGEEPPPPLTAAASGPLERLSGSGPKSPRYKLEGEVARGGMGAILRVWDEDLRRHLAMKVVLGRAPDSPASGEPTPSLDPRLLARFLEEAQVTGQLDHPGIVPVHELGLDSDGRVFFTMKLVKGRDLQAIFDLVFRGDRQWTETRVLGDLLKVCEAMAYAHAKKVIHRDLKPGNVMVGNFGEVYVMDWGLARVLDRKDPHDVRIATEGGGATAMGGGSALLTMDGDVLGTPSYMPPEQARGEIEKLSPRADVYAIGAMLYHLLTRRAPYTQPGAPADVLAVLRAVHAGPPPPLASLRPDVPAELAAIVEKAMAREPERRYADTLALASDLRAYLEHRVVHAYEAGAWAEARKWVQRNKPLAAALTAAVVLLVAGLSTSLVFKSRSDAKAVEAAEKGALATRKANDVLSLSAIQELKELTEAADHLWPAYPDNIAACDAWLARAKVLVDGRAADPSRNLAAHPGLQDHLAKLAEIRERALPRSPEQLESDRESSPRFAEWASSRGRLLWLRRMLGGEPWPAESAVEAQLAREPLPSEANALNDVAWPLVDPDPAKIRYGDEVKGLLVARRAVAVAKESERPLFRDTLAWALFRVGRFDDARAEERRGADEIDAARKKDFEGYLANLERAIADWGSPDARSARAREATELAPRVAVLEREVDGTRTFEFEDAQDRWWHAQLAELVADLESFRDESAGGLDSAGVSAAHGWGVLKRRQEAATIAERSTTGPEAKRRWEDAAAAIAANPLYSGLKLAPQIGLVPIGEDPDSHLWEFAHLQTGEPARRGADGKIAMTPDTGLVMVLLPAGKFWLGDQKTDPSGRNYDALANPDESPVVEVALDAFFLSKFEMTQAQWLRFAGRNPSQYYAGMVARPTTITLAHPVEQVSWTECMTTAERLGLMLPTEAQWEYAARAGTASVWWTGDAQESLAGAANLADRYCRENGGPTSWVYDDWLDDGWSVHAPVGTFRANAFGLHDVIGNVWEWCRDGNGGYGLPLRAGDGEEKPVQATIRVRRGGSFANRASQSRVGYRESDSLADRYGNLGLRPGRVVEDPDSKLAHR